MSKILGVLLFVAVVAFAGLLLLSAGGSLEPNTQASLADSAKQEQEAMFTAEGLEMVALTATLIVDSATGTPQVFELPVGENTTAMKLLEKSRLDFSAKYYDAGAFIESIGELKGGDNNKYWLYYVNDEMPMLAVDQLIVTPGDIIEFKYEESMF